MQLTAEVGVYFSQDGLGRAAIVRRPDGLFCIYVRWLWPESGMNWLEDKRPDITYGGTSEEAQRPLHGVYGTVDDARREVKSLRGFRLGDY